MTITNPLALAAGLGIKSGKTLEALTSKYNEDGSLKMTTMRALDIVEGLEDSTEELAQEAWQHLVDTRMAWRLQGSIGRQADRLIAAGFINPPQ